MVFKNNTTAAVLVFQTQSRHQSPSFRVMACAILWELNSVFHMWTLSFAQMPATRVKTLSFSFFLGIQNLLSLKMIHARPRVVDKLWQQVCSLDFITLKLFLGIFFRLTTPITQIYHWNYFLDPSPYFNEIIFSSFKTKPRPQTKIGCLYSQ